MGIFSKNEISAIGGEKVGRADRPAPITTADAMAEYCLDHKFNQGFDANWCKAHFHLIQNKLNHDEEVEMTFIGLHDYISLTEHQKNHAYAITGKNLYIVRKNLGGGTLKTLPLGNIARVSLQPEIAFGKMTLETSQGKLNIAIDNDHAEKIYSRLSSILKANK